MNLGFALVPLAFVMWAVTYPSRALPMLAPGLERLPARAVTYLRLAGPAALAALAATGSLLTTDAGGTGTGGAATHLQLGVMPAAVALCVLIVWRTKLLLLGVGAAVVLVAVAYALGLS